MRNVFFRILPRHIRVRRRSITMWVTILFPIYVRRGNPYPSVFYHRNRLTWVPHKAMNGCNIKRPRITFPRSNGEVRPNIYHRHTWVGFAFPRRVANGSVRLVNRCTWVHVASRVSLQGFYLLCRILQRLVPPTYQKLPTNGLTCGLQTNLVGLRRPFNHST